MKSIKHEPDDLLPEYSRSFFEGAVRGKYAYMQLELAQLVDLLLGCIGEDEGINFLASSPQLTVPHYSGQWTYEVEDNETTLRYWLNRDDSIFQVVIAPEPINSPDGRAELHTLLLASVRSVRAKVN